MAYARLLSAAAETDTELVAAPGAGKAIQILGIFISSYATNQISLYADDGSTLLHREFFDSDRPGIPLPSGSQPWDQLPENENLTITSTQATNTFTKIVYRLVGV